MDIEEYKKISNKEKAGRHPWEIARARIILFLLKKNDVPYSHILDIGSGDGFILRNLVKNQIAKTYSAFDTAYTDDLILELKTLSYAQDITFDKNFQRNPGNQSDCILLLDVLEHCENDHEVLGSVVNGDPTPNASFVITVPAFQGLFSQHDDLLGHFRRYTLTQITDLCESQKLEVIRGGYFFFSLLPIRIFQIFFEKLRLRKPKKTIDNWEANKVITNFISKILWVDFRICYAFSSIGINLPGLSAYCICRRLLP